ncbi:MAG: hypothetical protein AAF661_05180 [Pseudomonadota bacterium]
MLVKPSFTAGYATFTKRVDALRYCLAQRRLDGQNWQAGKLSNFTGRDSHLFAAVPMNGDADEVALWGKEELGDNATGLMIEIVHSKHITMGEAINAYMQEVIDGEIAEVRINGEDQTKYFAIAVADHLIDTVGCDYDDIESHHPKVFKLAIDHIRQREDDHEREVAEERSHQRAENERRYAGL